MIDFEAIAAQMYSRYAAALDQPGTASWGRLSERERDAWRKAVTGGTFMPRGDTVIMGVPEGGGATVAIWWFDDIARVLGPDKQPIAQPDLALTAEQLASLVHAAVDTFGIPVAKEDHDVEDVEDIFPADGPAWTKGDD